MVPLLPNHNQYSSIHYFPTPQSQQPPSHSLAHSTTKQLSLPITEPIQPTTNPPPSHPMVTRSQTDHLKPKHPLNLTHTRITPTPTTYTVTTRDHNWHKAMPLKFLALQKQSTWTLTTLSTNQTILGRKWTFRTKLNPNGTIARYKARLVAQGYKQEHGFDYHETFSLVAKLPTIRFLLIVALTQSWPIHQLDVSNAFLHGDLNEIVYMAQPPDFIDPQLPDHVILNLNKFIF